MLFKNKIWSALLALSLLGDFTAVAFVEPDWWPLIQATFTGVNLKRCQKRNDVIKPAAPPNGMACGSTLKTCFFDDQDCDGTPYPLTECFCDGSSWQCSPVSCPSDIPAVPSVPVRAPTTAPVPAPTTAPVRVPTTAPVPAPTTAPVRAPTTAPVRAPTTAPVRAPTTAPVRAPTTAPGTPTIPPCPSLQSIMAQPTQSCLTGLQCFYNFTGITGNEFCETSKVCRCRSSAFECQDDVNCVPVPTCPEFAVRKTATCSVPRTACQYEYSQTVGDQRCRITETCTCNNAGSYECVIDSETCEPRPVCPASPAAISSDPTCNAPGFICNYTSVEPVGDQLCTIVQECTCSDGLEYVCSEVSRTCETRDTCPSEPTPDQSCGLEGLECTYSIVTPIDGQRCNIVSTCTCTGSSYSCVDDQTCVDIPPETCPPTLADLEADPTCAVEGAGCGYRTVETLAGQICRAVNNCTCDGTEFICQEVDFTCQEAGTCPSVMEFKQDMTCTTQGLGCIFTSTESTNTEVCTVTQDCSCSGTQFVCTEERTCQPAPTCPTEIPRGSSCSFGGLGCQYTYSNNTGVETCRTTETCSCDGTTFNCIINAVSCADNPPPPPTPAPLTCPSVQSFIDGSRTCPGVGITCTYTLTSTTSNGAACDSTSVCPCTNSFVFNCTTTNVGAGC